MIRKTRATQTEPPAPTPPPTPPPPAPSMRKGAAKMSPFSIVVILIVLVTAAVLGLRNFMTPKSQPSTQAAGTTAPAISDDDIKALVAKVATHIAIKKDEAPTVATIQDANMLRQQNPVFYKDAQNGDRLLIWSDKAVLYSTSKDILLAVLPVSLPPNVPSKVTATTTAGAEMATPLTEKAVIEIRNGSGTPGLSRPLADALKAAGLKVGTPKDAKVKGGYDTTLVINMSGKAFPATEQYLTNGLGVRVMTSAEAPQAELPSSADFLIIVGKNYTP